MAGRSAGRAAKSRGEADGAFGGEHHADLGPVLGLPAGDQTCAVTQPSNGYLKKRKNTFAFTISLGLGETGVLEQVRGAHPHCTLQFSEQTEQT
jgi:hypothetical protein